MNLKSLKVTRPGIKRLKGGAKLITARELTAKLEIHKDLMITNMHNPKILVTCRDGQVLDTSLP